MKDLTLLYYTSNRISDHFRDSIIKRLLALFPDKVPIVSISHKPMDLGENVCVEGLEASNYNIYKQILIGAKVAKTKYVACVEDDALYVREHFEFRPDDDSFAYNVNRWQINRDFYFYRPRANMHTCIVTTDLMIKTLEARYEKYPNILYKGELIGFGEPGRSEYKLGLPYVNMIKFKTNPPVLVFNHRPSVGGVRRVIFEGNRADIVADTLDYWGPAADLWSDVYGQ